MSEPYWEPLAAAPSGKAWTTGDTKISAQTGNHADPAGGTWYLANGQALPGGETALIALVGANVPDAQGRTLVMKGSNADVDAIGDSDGLALANRRPKHKHNVVYSDGATSIYATNGVSGAGIATGSGGWLTTVMLSAAGLSMGPQSAAPTDTPAYVVPGNLFYHS